jgi:riboflavin biosynthesis pyrimidine reductase
MVVLNMSMSLDGLATGPNPGHEHPLGEDGERLHDWVFACTTGCSPARPTRTRGSATRSTRQARADAGDKDVGIWGGANVFQRYLEAGLVDEIQIHLVPVILGEGVRLFDRIDRRIELERARTIETPAATHLRFNVSRQS